MLNKKYTAREKMLLVLIVLTLIWGASMLEKAKALKNKIVGGVGKAMAAPVVKYHESKMRNGDAKYNVVRGFNDKYVRGHAPQDTPEYRKHKAAVEYVRDSYKK